MPLYDKLLKMIVGDYHFFHMLYANISTITVTFTVT